MEIFLFRLIEFFVFQPAMGDFLFQPDRIFILQLFDGDFLFQLQGQGGLN